MSRDEYAVCHLSYVVCRIVYDLRGENDSLACYHGALLDDEFDPIDISISNSNSNVATAGDWQLATGDWQLRR